MKLIGSALIILSCLMIYRRTALAQIKQTEQINAFVYLVRHIQKMIDRYAMPVEDILRVCRDEISKRLRVEEEVAGLYELLEKCELMCGDEVERALYDLAAELGKSNRESQIKLCDMTVEEILVLKKAKEKEHLSKKKMVAVLCMCGGGFLLITLL